MLIRCRDLAAHLPAIRADSAGRLQQRYGFAFDQAGLLVLPGEVGLAVEHLQGVGNGVVGQRDGADGLRHDRTNS